MSCAFLYDDKSRAAVVSSSGTLGDGGVDRLADPQPRHRMRLSGTSVQFTMDLGAVYPIDVFALISTTLTSAGTVRIRASAVDSTALSLLAHDTGVVAGVTGADRLGQVVHIPPNRKNVRYVRWDLTEPSGASIDVGLAPLGPLWRPLRNYSYGAQRGRQDYSIRDGNARTGANFGVKGAQARVRAFSLTSLDPTEVAGDVLQMDVLAGTAGDVLFIPETTDSMLIMAQDSIWGGFRQVGQPALTTHDSFQLLSRNYQMVERL